MRVMRRECCTGSFLIASARAQSNHEPELGGDAARISRYYALEALFAIVGE
jgi:hypothetical protein